MDKYNIIKSAEDVRLLEEASNGMHDGIIVSIEFKNDGINRTGDYSMSFDYQKVELKLRVRVTSDFDKVIELYFKEVYEYNLSNCPFDDIFMFSIVFEGLGVIWRDDVPDAPSSNYIHAKELSWRIISD